MHKAQARPRHFHYATACVCDRTALAHCNREREAQRWAAPRSAGPRRTAHMPTDTLRATALRRKEDDEMQRMDQLEQVWFGAIISPPLRVAPTTARPCRRALPSGPFDGCACRAFTRLAAHRSKRTPSLRRARRGAACSDRRCSPTTRTTAAAVRSRSSTRTRAVRAHCGRMHCTALHCTALHCRGQSNAFSSNRNDRLDRKPFRCKLLPQRVAFDLCAAMHSTLHCTLNIGDSVLQLSVGFALAPLWQS